MNRKIRITTLLISIAMLASSTVACGKETVAESSKEETTVTTTETTEPKETIPSYTINNAADATNVIAEYAAANNIDMNCYSQDMINMFVQFPDAYDFITQWPWYDLDQVERDYPPYEYPDISGEISKVVVPKLYQWDTRWGYRDYCGKMFGATGSGPTCVSIAAIYFLGNTDLTPAWIMDYAINNSFCDVNGGGTYRTLISTGANNLGIDVVQITVEEDRVKRNLDVGNLVVCSMGSGLFSNTYETEHYIIITGYSDEGFTIIDPASRTRTEQKWTWEGLATSMNIPWVYRMM